MGEILAEAAAETVVMLPLGGISALDAPGKPFHDPEADSALFRAIHEKLDVHARIRIIECKDHINHPMFADLAAMTLLQLLTTHTRPDRT